MTFSLLILHLDVGLIFASFWSEMTPFGYPFCSKIVHEKDKNYWRLLFLVKDMMNGTRRYASESTLILCVDLALDCDLNIRLGLDVEPSWLDTSCREMNGLPMIQLYWFVR